MLEEKFDSGMPEGMKPPKRVAVEALDMDWIFIGKNIFNIIINLYIIYYFIDLYR